MRDGSINIDYLEEYIFLAESLSFKATADHFYVSRSVISRHMAALEEIIGARLIERDSRSVMLTQAGTVFYRDAKTVLRTWRIALSNVRSVKGDSALIVRIGYLRNASRPVLVQFARHMTTTHPEVQVILECMEYAELRRALEEHAVDIALAMNVHPDISRNYRSTHLYDDKFYVVCSHDHPLAVNKDSLHLEDLRDQKLLIPDTYIHTGLAHLVEDLVSEDDLKNTHMFYQDIDMLQFKVLAEGYAALSSGMNNAFFGNRGVVLEIADVNTTFTVSAFYHDDFTGEAYRACREAFEWCHDQVK